MPLVRCVDTVKMDSFYCSSSMNSSSRGGGGSSRYFYEDDDRPNGDPNAKVRFAPATTNHNRDDSSSSSSSQRHRIFDDCCYYTDGEAAEMWYTQEDFDWFAIDMDEEAAAYELAIRNNKDKDNEEKKEERELMPGLDAWTTDGHETRRRYKEEGIDSVLDYTYEDDDDVAYLYAAASDASKQLAAGEASDLERDVDAYLLSSTLQDYGDAILTLGMVARSLRSIAARRQNRRGGNNSTDGKAGSKPKEAVGSSLEADSLSLIESAISVCKLAVMAATRSPDGAKKSGSDGSCASESNKLPLATPSLSSSLHNDDDDGEDDIDKADESGGEDDEKGSAKFVTVPFEATDIIGEERRREKDNFDSDMPTPQIAAVAEDDNHDDDDGDSQSDRSIPASPSLDTIDDDDDDIGGNPVDKRQESGTSATASLSFDEYDDDENDGHGTINAGVDDDGKENNGKEDESTKTAEPPVEQQQLQEQPRQRRTAASSLLASTNKWISGYGDNFLNPLSLPELRSRKQELKQRLKQLDLAFAKRHGRKPVKSEKKTIHHLYERYNALKDMIRDMEKTGRPLPSPSPRSSSRRHRPQH